MESSNLINKIRNVDGRHVMAGKETKSTLEGLAGRVRNIDGSVPQAILKKPTVVTKVGSINMPVKQTIESTGVEDAAESVQKVETTSYLEKVKHDIPMNNKDGKRINFRLIENLVKRDGADAVLPKESCRNHRSRIDIIRDANGVLHEGGNVPIVFVKHFEAFFGVEGVTSAVLSPDLFSHHLASSSAMDMILADRGDCNSVRCIMKSLQLFTDLSGLKPSLQKSTAFFCHVPHHVKVAILDVLPFEEGTLPVRYLGVPLISSRLTYKDCKILVDRLEKRITCWRNKFLSFAGRLQLIISVLSSMHVYWSSVFILPSRIIEELEAKMRGFLWCQGPMKKGKAKVSWEAICVPRSEGGLGIRRIGDMNKALMTSHIWSIITNRESLWVAWVHSYRLRGKSFWDYCIPIGLMWYGSLSAYLGMLLCCG
ncbi:hypothetical protein QVD17_06854 [Tagetes erecta]|uniref:Reverse transcriptase n=1 Tax=Tagetes erecta TaxID=13708 RepID=A0AAD8PBM6_TARER|nr:hypothetical protein QVD17_06854 [Tagetes erecta]